MSSRHHSSSAHFSSLGQSAHALPHPPTNHARGEGPNRFLPFIMCEQVTHDWKMLNALTLHIDYKTCTKTPYLSPPAANPTPHQDAHPHPHHTTLAPAPAPTQPRRDPQAPENTHWKHTQVQLLTFSTHTLHWSCREYWCYAHRLVMHVLSHHYEPQHPSRPGERGGDGEEVGRRRPAWGM